jgi:hypothetical protein
VVPIGAHAHMYLRGLRMLHLEIADSQGPQPLVLALMDAAVSALVFFSEMPETYGKGSYKQASILSLAPAVMIA